MFYFEPLYTQLLPRQLLIYRQFLLVGGGAREVGWIPANVVNRWENTGRLCPAQRFGVPSKAQARFRGVFLPLEST